MNSRERRLGRPGTAHISSGNHSDGSSTERMSQGIRLFKPEPPIRSTAERDQHPDGSHRRRCPPVTKQLPTDVVRSGLREGHGPRQYVAHQTGSRSSGPLVQTELARSAMTRVLRTGSAMESGCRCTCNPLCSPAWNTGDMLRCTADRTHTRKETTRWQPITTNSYPMLGNRRPAIDLSMPDVSSVL